MVQPVAGGNARAVARCVQAFCGMVLVSWVLWPGYGQVPKWFEWIMVWLVIGAAANTAVAIWLYGLGLPRRGPRRVAEPGMFTHLHGMPPGRGAGVTWQPVTGTLRDNRTGQPTGTQTAIMVAKASPVPLTPGEAAYLERTALALAKGVSGGER